MARVGGQHQLRFEIETKECQIPADVRNRIQSGIDSIAKAVLDFPEPQLWIMIVFHPQSQRYHAQAKLRLPGRTIITGAYDQNIDAAFDKCAAQVAEQINDYKSQPNREALERAERLASLTNDVIAPVDPDVGQLGEAVRTGDYNSFRRALLGHEEWVRMRVGRWIQRYPGLDVQIDNGVKIADLVEAVFLMAFEDYATRSKAKAISEWLDELIDPAVRGFRDSAEEREAVRRIASMTGLDG